MSKKVVKIVMLAAMSVGLFLSVQTEASAIGAQCNLCGGSGTFIACYDCGCAAQYSGSCIKALGSWSCYCVY